MEEILTSFRGSDYDVNRNVNWKVVDLLSFSTANTSYMDLDSVLDSAVTVAPVEENED